MRRILTYQITDEEENFTVQKFLAERVGLSRRQISGLKFRDRGICVNGDRCRVTTVLKAGDCLTFLAEEDGESGQLVSGLEVPEILFEDEELLVVNKPAGILTHPVGGHYGDTLSNQVAAYYRSKGEPSVIRPVGRLDKDTSGAVLFAKTRLGAAQLTKKGEGKAVEKIYLAFVQGVPEKFSGEIYVPMGRCDGEKLKMEADPVRGKTARTFYRVVECMGEYSLVALGIDTGRTHQIRVHMTYLGHPLLGDSLYGEGEKMYGDKGEGFQRAALHAFRLKIFKPFSDDTVEVTAPLPEDFQKHLSEDQIQRILNRNFFS